MRRVSVSEKDDRRNRLIQLLFRMAGSQKMMRTMDERQAVYKELEDIYDDGTEKGFRHYYSDIFSVLSQIDSTLKMGDTEILSQNMNIIQKGYKRDRRLRKNSEGKTIDVSANIEKLYDHINLDIARINYSKGIELRSQEELQKVNKTLAQVRKEINSMEDSVNKAKNVQKEYITILGIFASIVLAFTGGMAFSTSILENMATTGIYRLILIVIGLAFVLMNVIYLLTRFVQEIAKKENEHIPYPKIMKTFNSVCAVALILLILCWVFDVNRGVEMLRGMIYP